MVYTLVKNRVVVLLVVSFMIAQNSYAQGPPPPPPPPCPACLPIDQGAILLVLIALFLGIYTLFKMRKLKKENTDTSN